VMLFQDVAFASMICSPQRTLSFELQYLTPIFTIFRNALGVSVGKVKVSMDELINQNPGFRFRCSGRHLDKKDIIGKSG
jgi:hypothetical protein